MTVHGRAVGRLAFTPDGLGGRDRDPRQYGKTREDALLDGGHWTSPRMSGVEGGSLSETVVGRPCPRVCRAPRTNRSSPILPLRHSGWASSPEAGRKSIAESRNRASSGGRL